MLLLCLLKCLAFLLLCQLLFFFFSSRKIITQVTTMLGFTIPAVSVTAEDIVAFLIPLGVTAIRFCIRRANSYAQLTGKLPIDISSCSVGGLPHPQGIPTGHVAELGFLTGRLDPDKWTVLLLYLMFANIGALLVSLVEAIWETGEKASPQPDVELGPLG